MRNQSGYLALITVLLYAGSSAYAVQSGVRGADPRRHIPAGVASDSYTAARVLLELTAAHAIEPEVLSSTDSLQWRWLKLLPSGEGSFSDRIHGGSGLFKRSAPTNAHLYVIDTALVHDARDTTRHLYSNNPRGKKISDVTQRWVGGRWVDFTRQSSSYDQGDYLLSDLVERWSNGAWTNVSRVKCTYDAEERMISTREETWSDGAWTESGNKEWTYNADGIILSHVEETWSNGIWLQSLRETYTYRTDGLLVSELVDTWSSNGESPCSYLYTFTYDLLGQMDSEVHQLRSNGRWVNYQRFEFQRKEVGPVTWAQYSYWSNDRWVACMGVTYVYNTSGKQTLYLLGYVSNGAWMNSLRTTCTYDANNNLLTRLVEYWLDYENIGWMVSWRETLSYDTQGRPITELYESYTSSQWGSFSRFTYSYDPQGNLTSVWHFDWVNSSWKPTNIANPEWVYTGSFAVTDSGGNQYVYEGYNFTFSYKSVESIASSGRVSLHPVYSLSQNYPNPFNPTTTISYELSGATHVKLTVFDLLGREVNVLVDDNRPPGVFTVQFDPGRIAGGIYFYRLQAGTFVQTKRLLFLR